MDTLRDAVSSSSRGPLFVEGLHAGILPLDAGWPLVSRHSLQERLPVLDPGMCRLLVFVKP